MRIEPEDMTADELLQRLGDLEEHGPIYRRGEMREADARICDELRKRKSTGREISQQLAVARSAGIEVDG